MLSFLRNKLDSYRTAPPWRRWLLIGALAFAGVYLLWCRFGSKPPTAGQTIEAQPAKATKDMPQKVITPRRVVVIADGAKAAENLHIDPPQPREEVQTAVTVPELKYGGTSTTFLNASTGESRTVIKANEAPWFALRRDSAVGIGYGIGTEGQTIAARYRRDVLQVKALTLSGELEANYAERRERPIEGRAMVWGEIRW
jgi:hypothetical protein